MSEEVNGIDVGDVNLEGGTPGRPAYGEIFQGENGEFYVRKKGGNHETVWTSEGYPEVGIARKAARRELPGLEVREVE